MDKLTKKELKKLLKNSIDMWLQANDKGQIGISFTYDSIYHLGWIPATNNLKLEYAERDFLEEFIKAYENNDVRCVDVVNKIREMWVKYD